MSFTKIKNHKINYIKKGKGKPVILIHGWNCSIPFWDQNINEFSKNYCIYALDLPGFGDSPPTLKHYSINEYTELLKDFMGKLNIKKTVLVGHSMGGAIALDFIEKYPNKVEKLVLIDTLIKKVPFILKFLLIPFIGKKLHNFTIKNYYYLKYTGWALFHNKKVYNEKIIHAVLKTNSFASLNSLKSYNKTNFTLICNKIKVPVFIVIGDRTIFIMKRHAKLLKKNIKNSEIILIKNSKHAPMMENSSFFNNHVLSAISRSNQLIGKRKH